MSQLGDPLQLMQLLLKADLCILFELISIIKELSGCAMTEPRKALHAS